jgi:acyl-coenzyme A synthetase/AMP-(fatty) acid ligase/acyl carrier protein
MQATPATWQLLLDAGWENSPKLKMLCGGEALSRELADRLLAKGELWNMYGPTETTVWSSVSKVEPGKGPVPVGPPIQNTQFYVLDKNSHPVPIGIPGELYIGGDGIARGYYKHPDWTAERFVPNPFPSAHNAIHDADASAADTRLYRTGDLVRYRVDGQLEFLGRLDHQVKIRGFRIELGEIEAALSRHPSVRESAVVVTEDPSGSKRLTASVVSADSQTLTAEELRTSLGKWVPAYMIPSLFVFLPALPRTPNGKLDRKTLPQLQNGNPHASEHVKPSSETEKQLAAICQEVLHLEKISVADNVFDLGADSLHLFQIIARASGIGLDITPFEILQMRTIAAIAKTLDARRSSGSQGASAPGKIVRVSRDSYRIDSVSAPA